MSEAKTISPILASSPRLVQVALVDDLEFVAGLEIALEVDVIAEGVDDLAHDRDRARPRPGRPRRGWSGSSRPPAVVSISSGTSVDCAVKAPSRLRVSSTCFSTDGSRRQGHEMQDRLGGGAGIVILIVGRQCELDRLARLQRAGREDVAQGRDRRMGLVYWGCRHRSGPTSACRPSRSG